MSQPVVQDVDNVSSNKVKASGEKGYIQLSDGVGNFRSNRYFTFDNESTPKNLTVGIQGGGILAGEFLIGNASNNDNNLLIQGGQDQTATPGILFGNPDDPVDTLRIGNGLTTILTGGVDDHVIRPKPNDNGEFGRIDIPFIPNNPIPGKSSGDVFIEAVGGVTQKAGDSLTFGNGGDVNITSGAGRGVGNNSGGIFLFGSNVVIGLDDFGVDAVRGNFKIITDSVTYILPKNIGAVGNRLTIQKIKNNIVTLYWGPP